MSNLMDFGMVRNWKQALLFYVVYLVAVILIGAIIGGLAGLIFGVGFQVGVRIGGVIAILVCLVLGYLILRDKGHTKHVGYWLLVLLSGALATIGGGLLGLIPICFLTTRRKNKTKASVSDPE